MVLGMPRRTNWATILVTAAMVTTFIAAVVAVAVFVPQAALIEWAHVWREYR